MPSLIVPSSESRPGVRAAPNQGDYPAFWQVFKNARISRIFGQGTSALLPSGNRREIYPICNSHPAMFGPGECHDLGDLVNGRPREILLTYSQHRCSTRGKYFNADIWLVAADSLLGTKPFG